MNGSIRRLSAGIWREGAWTTLLLAASLVLLSASDPQSFEGRWSTTFGELELVQVGSRLSGTYGETASGSLVGEVQGKELRFHYADAGGRGEGRFQLAEDGESFVGTYAPRGTGRWREWSGERLAVRAPRFVGLWETTYGRLRVVPRGDELIGSCDSATGPTALEGRRDGARWTFSYEEPEDRGRGWFELSEDGGSFVGEWSGEAGSGAWSGTRIQPRPGKRWLVVLEAHWEEELGEAPYAFGDMLRAYFRMPEARHVEFRQRYFHDAADLERFAREVAFLPEPVVLVVATHGTARGLVVGEEEIDPELLGRSLAWASNLELLHLSGCEMMRTRGAERVRRGLPSERGFPISGYTTVVAWDASALGDFVFLSLVLLRGLPPERAVAEAHRLAPFTRGSFEDSVEFEALGLVVD